MGHHKLNLCPSSHINILKSYDNKFGSFSFLKERPFLIFFDNIHGWWPDNYVAFIYLFCAYYSHVDDAQLCSIFE